MHRRLPLVIRLIVVGQAFAMACAGSSIFAANGKDEPAPTVTIVGEAMCARCALKEAGPCQTVVEVASPEGGTTRYYLAQNDLSRAHHEYVCRTSRKVKVTGTVAHEADRLVLTASKIESAD